jgi:PAS domain S-box-containing protein
MGSGSIVMLLTLASGWWFMQRHVLRPIANLAQASERLATGDLATRTTIDGDDELALLGRSFNHMAENLDQSLQTEKKKERFLQSLIDAIPDGIRVIGPDFRVIMANTAFCRMHGRQQEEVRGQPCYTASHARIDPCPETLEVCPLQQVRQCNRSVKTVARHTRADGSPIDVEVFASPLTMVQGDQELACIVESVRDLQHDIRYSQELKLSEVGRLATGVAHEIHNPLAAIRIALQASLRALKQGAPSFEEVSNYLKLVDGEIDHCVEVTERLLKLGGGSGRPQLVHLNSAVRDMLSLTRWEAIEKGVQIDERLDVSDPRVLATESDMRIVVLNLVQNALHAMPEGGILTVSTTCRDGKVELEVADTGVGIPLEDRSRIFMPFFSRRADGVQGTGLGLSICKSAVEASGGCISVVSAVGSGSRFTVTLPDAGVTRQSA